MSSEFRSDFPEVRTDSQFPEEDLGSPYREEPIQPIFNILEELREMMAAQSRPGSKIQMVEPPPEEELG